MQKQHKSVLTVIFKLFIGGLTSVILIIVLSTVNLQFQEDSLRSVLEIVTAYVTATVWSSCN